MTFRNLVAIAVILFGTSFLWLLPAMSGKAEQTLTGPLWTVVQVLVWLLIGFIAAAWGIFKALSWWLPALALSSVVGILASLLYLIAVRGVPGVTNVASNVAIHAGISVVLLVAVAVPALRSMLTDRM